MTYGELSGIFRMILQAVLVVLLVMQINVVMSLTFDVKKHSITFLQMIGIIMNAGLLSVFMGQHQAVFRELKSTFMINSASGMPIWILAMLLGVIMSIFVGSAVYLKRLQNKIITESSIKESTDDLPMGLCFAKKDGLTLLVNRKMYMLSLVIMGTALQNARHFWEMVSKGDLPEGIIRVKEGNEPMLLLQNGSVWTFSKKYIKIDRDEIVQILAIDTTDLYNLRFELESKNESLKEMNIRLHEYSENVTDLVREEEILATKVKIHADLGSVLLATRYYLNHPGGKEQAESLIKSWDYNVALLYNEANQEVKENLFQQLDEAAKAVGVTIEVNGKIPENNMKVERLIVAAARECLTNTVRHGDGNKVVIWIRENHLYYHVEYTNNGTVPEESVREGGGLMGLRRRVEDMGGNMQIISHPQFVLLINIPKEKG